MSFARRRLAFVLLPFIAACASVVKLDGLKPPTDQADTVHVTSFTYGARDKKLRNSIGLKDGDYVAEFENDAGVFYRGPGRCVFIPDVVNMNKTKYPDNTRYGGIYISKSQTRKEYRVYYYQDNDPNPNQLDPVAMQQVVQAGSPSVGATEAGVGTAVGMGAVDYMIQREQGQIILVPTTSEIDIASHVSKP